MMTLHLGETPSIRKRGGYWYLAYYESGDLRGAARCIERHNSWEAALRRLERLYRLRQLSWAS